MASGGAVGVVPSRSSVLSNLRSRETSSRFAGRALPARDVDAGPPRPRSGGIARGPRGFPSPQWIRTRPPSEPHGDTAHAPKCYAQLTSRNFAKTSLISAPIFDDDDTPAFSAVHSNRRVIASAMASVVANVYVPARVRAGRKVRTSPSTRPTRRPPPVSPTRVAASKPSSKQPLSSPIHPSQTVRGSPIAPTLTRPARRTAAKTKPSMLTLARAVPTDSCELDNFQRVSVLAEALPYLQRFAGQTVVVKYGGAAMTDESLKDRVIKDLVLLSTVGIRPILVHGGGPEINGWLKKVGIEPKVSLFWLFLVILVILVIFGYFW